MLFLPSLQELLKLYIYQEYQIHFGHLQSPCCGLVSRHIHPTYLLCFVSTTIPRYFSPSFSPVLSSISNYLNILGSTYKWDHMVFFYISLSIIFSKFSYVIESSLEFISFFHSLRFPYNIFLDIFTLFLNSTLIHLPPPYLPPSTFVLFIFSWVYGHPLDHGQLIKDHPLGKLILLSQQRLVSG